MDRTDTAALDAAASESPAALALTLDNWVSHPHLLEIDSHLRDLVRRSTSRLLIELPIRHGGTTLVSQVFPAWWLMQKPDDQIILATYGKEFSTTLSGRAKRLFFRHGRVRGDAEYWHVEDHQGSMRAFGVGQATYGVGADLLIVDSPIKDMEAANSEAARDSIWDWCERVIATRLKPGGVVVVLDARWHEDDVPGRIRAQGGWQILSLPALAREDDPLGRQIGEALCPAMYTRAQLLAKQRQIGHAFRMLFQLAPEPAVNHPPEGS